MTPMYSSPHPSRDREVDWNPPDSGGGNPYPNVGGGGNPYPNAGGGGNPYPYGGGGYQPSYGGGGGNPYPHVGGGYPPGYYPYAGGGYPPGYDAHAWGMPEPQGHRGGHHSSSYRPQNESYRNDRSGTHNRREDAWDTGANPEAEDVARASGWNVTPDDNSRRQRDHSPRDGARHGAPVPGWGEPSGDWSQPAEDWDQPGGDWGGAGGGGTGGDWGGTTGDWGGTGGDRGDRGAGPGWGETTAAWGTAVEDWAAMDTDGAAQGDDWTAPRRSSRSHRRKHNPSDRDDGDHYRRGRSHHTYRDPPAWPEADDEEEGEVTWGQGRAGSWSLDDEDYDGARRGRRGSSPPPLLERSHRGHRSHHGHSDRRKHRDGPPSDAPPLGGPNGGPRPRRSSMKYRRAASADHLPQMFTYHGSSGTSTDSFRAAMLQHGGAVPAAALRRSGSGLKKAMRWLKRPVGTGNVALHPLLRPASLLRPAGLNWYDVTRLPLPTRGGIPISPGAMFKAPATTPPSAYMSLLIPIPGLPDGHWVCEVLPMDLGPPGSPDFPGTPYAMPNAFSSFSGSPFPLQSLAGSQVPVVTTAALLLAVHSALHRRVTSNDYFALTPERQNRVSKAFWRRCRRMGGSTERAGMLRLDFLGDKIKWEGLVPLEMDQWLVRLGRP